MTEWEKRKWRLNESCMHVCEFVCEYMCVSVVHCNMMARVLALVIATNVGGREIFKMKKM